mmetsp:Transcript_21417/g.46522  ORF Transcript_21417/g.46522 Transcript_21417/m.46522 type:complete len:129 (+) Transcript_21417:57-443(+)
MQYYLPKKHGGNAPVVPSLLPRKGRIKQPKENLERVNHAAETIRCQAAMLSLSMGISLQSLNWQEFWQQVKLMRPKITQSSLIGIETEHGTVLRILRFNTEPATRLIINSFSWQQRYQLLNLQVPSLR